MAALTQRRLRRSRFTPRIINGLAQHLPFPENTFHQVVATFPPEFIFAEDTFREALRVLIPQGELIVLPNAWITGQRAHEKIAARLFDITGQSPPWDQRFLRYFRNAEFEIWVEESTGPGWKLLIIRARKPAA